ncbi:pantothenate kinase [Pseudomonas sp. UL073]|uniref:Type III pantothenate kinase n=1 Tax=Zestomonas insulae TaxID=2809017 RepID=A0ABS2ILE1_9GAMM|nr:pantothenate kinase [Pseudomonas insulae]MBM7062703.1 pantothenate kinase [Pseudomonas insulae]
MILELDCGNSFIKWRVLSPAQTGIVAFGSVGVMEELERALQAIPALALAHARLVSVRSDEETAELVAFIAGHFGIDACCARPELSRGGVRNGYEDFARLGLDRWLAILGAYQQSPGACLVLDLGTAVTSDFVAPDGQHLGGFICPGMPLMRNQLRTHTRRIRYDDAAALEALVSLEPGRSTVEAVERGCVLMLKGFVQAQLEIARGYWGDGFETYLTGGDAKLLAQMLPRARLAPDLIFSGLAVACPLP